MKKPNPSRKFPALVKSAMFERGIGGDEMATYLHISLSTYQRRMNNPNEFTVSNLRVFKEKLKIDPQALIEAVL